MKFDGPNAFDDLINAIRDDGTWCEEQLDEYLNVRDDKDFFDLTQGPSEPVKVEEVIKKRHETPKKELENIDKSPY